MPGGIEIPALGLGTWQLTGEKCVEAVKIALELGYRHIDTAEDYGNETEIGEAIEGFDRKKLFITSKVWANHFHYDDTLKACDDSLQRLGTDYLDLYLIHWRSKKVQLEETLKAMQELKEQGKIKALGVSNYDEKLMDRAIATGYEIATNQVEFHPLLYQKELLDYCHGKGIPITAYSPIARGHVFQNSILKGIAEKKGKTEAQVSLKWLLQKGMIVIPKSSSREHLKENLDLFDWQLEKEEIAEIDSIKERKRQVNINF